VNFVFTDETGVKHRPALIISSDSYYSGRQEAIITAITSRTDRILAGDHLISDWKSAGLLFPSVATGIIRTVKTSMVDCKLGSVSRPDMKAIEGKLRLILDLPLTT
jgi:mRNA interferase MazF